MARFLIIGAGITGATLAHRLSKDQHNHIALYESKSKVGGACADTEINNTVLGSSYYISIHGPHIFHTNDKQVYEIFSRAALAIPYCHKVKGLIDGQYVSVPFNFNTIEHLFSNSTAKAICSNLEQAAAGKETLTLKELQETKVDCLLLLVDYIKKHMLSWYSMKQWGIDSIDKLPESVINRVPVRISRNDSYFLDRYQCLPGIGYTEAIKNLICSPNIKLYTDSIVNCDTFEFSRYDNVFITAPIDSFFKYSFGALPYRSLKFCQFDGDHHPNGEAVINYCENHEYTRSTVYENFYTNFVSKRIKYKTTVYEKSFLASKDDEKYYPVESEASLELYSKYVEYAKQKIPNAIFCGRLGAYKYINMDKAMRLAIDLADNILKEIKSC